jgi:hypothetical protein
MDDEDRRVLHEILGRGEGFGHRQHVELAWRLLATHGTDQAADAVAAAIRQVAAAHGQPGKFHETITKSWAMSVRTSLSAFVTYDKRLAAAAQETGLPVLSPA